MFQNHDFMQALGSVTPEMLKQAKNHAYMELLMRVIQLE